MCEFRFTNKCFLYTCMCASVTVCVTLLVLDIKTEENSEPLCIISQNYM